MVNRNSAFFLIRRWKMFVKFYCSFNDLPIQEIKPGKSNDICFLIKHWFWSKFETCLVCVSDGPSWEKRSCPIIGLWPSSTTVTLTFAAAQSLNFTDVLITTMVLNNSLDKIFNSWVPGDCAQKLSWVFNTTGFARFLLMIVQTLREDTNAFVFVFLMQLFTLTGSTSLILSLSKITAPQFSSNPS